MNRPTQKRCRACGRSLRAPKPTEASVGLQRVTSGEVFTAVVDAKAAAPETMDVAPSKLPEASPPEPREGDDLLRFRETVAQRLSERAAASDQRFKPYSAARNRAPERPEDRVAVTRQLEAAARAFREKHYETAVEHLLKAIAKDDRDPRSWTLLGQAYLRCDRPYKAAVGYLRAIDLEPRNASAWLALSRVFTALEDLEGAREVLDRTVQMSPGFPEAWAERGQILEELGNRAEATKSFKKALELRPEHRAARERYEKLAAAEPAAPSPAPVAPAPALAPPAPVPEPTEAEDEELPDFTDLAELPAKEAPIPRAEETPRGRPARLRTYIDGLDEAIGGGIPWGHVILIEGSPGTLKSSVGFSILLQNAARGGLHGLYLSLKERTSSLLKQMSSVGLHLQVNQGSFVVLDPRAAKGLMEGRSDWVEALRSAVAAIQSQRGLDLLVIDSLDALEVHARAADRRQEVFRLFEWLRDLDATSFVIAERPSPVPEPAAGHIHRDEDFLADGILQLSQHLVSDQEVQRRLRIVRMRGTRHDLGPMPLLLDEGRFRVARRVG